ncbi:hypothetical protein [Rugamonas sp. DEMB1]|uniref:hypothetical protein n=1 Tax=Rugamonas sp. DEMB1 TaxID=3039386 RepID=UPI0024468338|nr:hypothetical protein [Rugamonas sp. DEMB1]WGG48664.1 hypothetical protein QC826_18585 [Rugamonas sp. DEMB1]
MAGLVLFDTNILIDWSKGYAEALTELAHWDNPGIAIMQASAEIMSERRRLGPKIGLADAIIQATADVKKLTIITRNTKDFKGANVRVPYELKTVTTVSVVNVDPPGDTPNPPRSVRLAVPRTN